MDQLKKTGLNLNGYETIKTLPALTKGLGQSKSFLI